MKKSLLAITFLFSFSILFLVHAQVQKTNVIYIMADDLGYGDLGCYGQEKINTPGIDKMASEGMRFTQHYAGATVCAPSRSVLMTGQHLGHTFVRGNKAIGKYQLPIPAETHTIAEMFKNAGYVTSCIGKWGLGGPGTEGHPNKQGFDHFFGYLGQVQAHNYYPDYLWRNTDTVWLNNGEYSHDEMTEEALAFIHDHKGEAFFLYIPYTIPHTNFQVPEKKEYEGLEGWTQKQQTQAAMISRMDGDVARILDTLRQLGIEENTLVVFTSDNGPHGAGGTLDFFDANGALRGKKRDLYEGGIRIPFVAWWPGTVEAGTETDHVACFTDLFATCCELTGQPIPENTDGISYLPTLLQKTNQEKHDFIYHEFHEKKQGGTKQSVRIGKWKGVRKNMQKDVDSPIELYNLNTDLSETTDVSGQYPEIVARIDYVMLTQSAAAEFFNFAQPTNVDIKGIDLATYNNITQINPEDTIQLAVTVTPSNAFDKSFDIKAESVTSGLECSVNKLGQLIVNNVSGMVNVIVTSKVNDEITDTLKVLVGDVSGVTRKGTDSKITLLTNPVSNDEIRFMMEGVRTGEELTVCLLDINGKAVYVKKLPAEEGVMTIREVFEDGVYFLQIDNSEFLWSKKIVLK